MLRVVVCLGLFSLAAVLAQTPTGAIVGSVTDPSGGAVVNARIELANAQTALKRNAMSDTAGGFRVPDLPAGVYALVVEAPGFKKYQQSGITVTVNRNVTLNAVLQVGTLSESVTVTTSPPQVDTVSGALSSQVGPREAKELPLNGRNVLQLMTLNPGLNSANTNHGSISGYPTYAVNGARGDQVNFLLDGATNSDDMNNIPNYFPNPDAMQEFSVLTNGFSAEYGMGAGGVVNSVTRSGTNRLHASAFEFVRNQDFNGADFFSHAKDTLKRNQYGGAIGGPVYAPKLYNSRDKTFFFYSYQGTKNISAASNRTVTVPTAAERNGDFSQSALGRPIDPQTGQPFPGAQIPANRLDPVIVKMLDALVPLPNAGGNILRFLGAPSKTNDYQHLVKIDHSPSSKDKLMGRFFMLNFNNPLVKPAPTPTGVNIFAGVNSSTAANLLRSINTVASETHIFSPTLLHILTLDFNRLNSTLLAPIPDKNYCDFGRKMHCFPGGLRLGTPQFAFPGETNQWQPRESFRLADSLNWIRGRHNLKFGLDLRSVRADVVSDVSNNGTPYFSGQFTNNAFADLLLGIMANDGGRNYYPAMANRGFFQSFYAQNDIRVNSRLSINVGLRWDPYIPWVEKWDKLHRFDPAAYYAGLRSQRFINAPPGLFFVGDKLPDGSILSRATVGNDFKMFAPRFGFAYTPFGKAKTSIRGGYGVFFDQQVEPILLIRQKNDPPFNPGQWLYGAPFADPYNGGPDPYASLSIPPKPDTQFLLPLGNVYTLNPGFRPAYIQQWNLTVEQQLMRDLLLRVSYVGTKGNRLEITRNINTARYIPGNSTVANTNDRRPFGKDYGIIGRNNSDGLSIYHALQITTEQRFSHGVQFNVNYTWSRAIDMGSSTLEGADCCGSDIPQNPNNSRADRGLSSFDVHHRFVASGIWDIPAPAWKSPIAKAALKGWELSPIAIMQTGAPLNITTGQDRSFSSNGFDRPDAIGNPVLSNSRSKQDKIARYFDPTVFVLNQFGQFGNLGRNGVRGPGFVNVDMGLFKNFRFKESGNVQFRWEMFNAFNHANLSNPTTSWGVNLGRILADRGPRVMQLSLKLQY